MNRKYFGLVSMCESYSGPAKSGPIKRSRLHIFQLCCEMIELECVKIIFEEPVTLHRTCSYGPVLFS